RPFPAGVAASAPSASLAQGGEADRAPLIDTHMPVWTDDTRHFPFDHPYDPKFKPPKTPGTAELLLKEMDDFGVTHCVLVQVIYHGWDNRYVAHCLKAHPRRFRGRELVDPTDAKAAQRHEVSGRKQA